MESDEGGAAAAAEPRMRAAALLGGAIASTVALMRRNAKFGASGYGGGVEDPLLQGFRTLRRQLYAWRDWHAVAPLEYLAPFLAVVRSDETSGPITGAALAALYAVLAAGLVRPEAPGATEAMHALVDAVTHCRFEARAAAARARAGPRRARLRACAGRQPYGGRSARPLARHRRGPAACTRACAPQAAAGRPRRAARAAAAPGRARCAAFAALVPLTRPSARSRAPRRPRTPGTTRRCWPPSATCCWRRCAAPRARC
jgi:hypothetical protein